MNQLRVLKGGDYRVLILESSDTESLISLYEIQEEQEHTKGDEIQSLIHHRYLFSEWVEESILQDFISSQNRLKGE